MSHKNKGIYSIDFYQTAITIKKSNLFISFCSFDLSSPILKKEIFIENLYILLTCLVK